VHLQLRVAVAAVLKAQRLELVVTDREALDLGLPVAPHASARVISAVDAKVAASPVVCV